RGRQVGGQKASGRVNRRLNFLLRHVEGQVQIELQRDDRGPGGARREHLFESGHLPELALERRGNRGGRHVRARTRVKANHLDRRIIDLWQCRDWQQAIGDDPCQEDGEHQQRGRYRPQDERARRAHPITRKTEFQPPLLAGLLGPPGDLAAPAVPLRVPLVCAAPRALGSMSSTFAPSRSLSAPSTTTMFPASSPLSTSVVSPSTAPSLTGVTATLWSGLTRNTKVPGAPR